MDFNSFFASLYILYLPEIYSIQRFIFSNFTSSGNKLGGRYYPMCVFTPVNPICELTTACKFWSCLT